MPLRYHIDSDAGMLLVKTDGANAEVSDKT